MRKIATQYDKDANIKYISKETTYQSEDGQATIRETSVYKKVYGGRHFWRVWLGDLLYTLGLINNSKQMDVVFHVMENTDASSNLFIGTLRQVAADTEISYKTVATIFKKMQDVNLITKQQSGLYKVNPSLLIKGDEHKKQRLVIEYEKVKSNAKAEKKHEDDNIEGQMDISDYDL